jgi:hypothetical protein
MPHRLLRVGSLICLLVLIPAFVASLHATAEMCFLGGAFSPHLWAELGLGLSVALLSILAPAMACNWMVYRQPGRAWAWMSAPLVAGLLAAIGLLAASNT